MGVAWFRWPFFLLLFPHSEGVYPLRADLGVTAPTTVHSIMPNISQAKKYAYTCGAAYCFEVVTAWSCHYCQEAKRFGQEFAGLVENKEAKTTALFTLNKKEKEIVLAFRGSINVLNVIQDAAIFKADTIIDKPTAGRNKTEDLFSTLAGAENNVKVHIGFLTALNSIYFKMIAKLKELMLANLDYNLVITGHSLGAAMAAIALYLIRERVQVGEDMPVPKSWALYCYGGPRIGNKAFADYFNNCGDMVVIRVVNNMDAICQMPVANSGWFHFGTELWLRPNKEEKVCTRELYEDPTCQFAVASTPSVTDHLKYWDVYVLTCSVNNPTVLLAQFIV